MTLSAEQQMLLDTLKKWQKSENMAVAYTARVMEETSDPLLRLVAEIIQRDSLLHHRIQEIIRDDIERSEGSVPASTDFDKVWDLLLRATELEDKFIDLGSSCLEAMRAGGDRAHDFLLKYLINEEKKHKALLEDLRKLRESAD